MINETALKRISELSELYEKRWGKPVDYLTPPPVTQEMLVSVLERIVDTGESVTVGFEKIFNVK